MAEFPTPARLAIQAALSAGKSATQALSEFRSEGGKMRTQTFYRFYGTLQLEGIAQSVEATRPYHRAPIAGEILPLEVKHPGGFLHRLVIVGRDKDGLVISKRVSLKVRKPLSRKQQIKEALARIAGSLKDYGITPETGFPIGTFELVPEGE